MEVDKSKKEFERPLLKKSVRWVIFVTLWVQCVHVSQSSGILSPSGSQISEDLQMNQVEYGCISPVYSIGRWVGAWLFAFVANAVNRKYMMVFAGVTHGVINMFFMFTSNGYIILACRCFAGIGHIWPPIYTGLWVGQFAIQRYAKLWKNFSSITSPFGRASGFFIDLFAGAQNVRKNYIIIFYFFLYSGDMDFSTTVLFYSLAVLFYFSCLIFTFLQS